MSKVLFSFLVFGFVAGYALAGDEVSPAPGTQLATTTNALPLEWRNVLADPVTQRIGDDVWGETSEVHLISLPSKAERGTPIAQWESIFADPVAERKDTQVLARIESTLPHEWKNVLTDPVTQRKGDDVWGETSEVHLISLPSKAERGTSIASLESGLVAPVTERNERQVISDLRK